MFRRTLSGTYTCYDIQKLATLIVDLQPLCEQDTHVQVTKCRRWLNSTCKFFNKDVYFLTHSRNEESL